MDVKAVDPWWFGTASEPLFGNRVRRVGHTIGLGHLGLPRIMYACAFGNQLPLKASDTPGPSVSASAFRDMRPPRHMMTGCESRCRGNRDSCQPQAAAGEYCSKFRRQIAVDLKANAHFDERRSCP